MRAFVNPLLFIICILLFAFGYATSSSGDGGAGVSESWVLTLCLLGTIINGTLGVARAMTQRPAMANIGWAVGFLVAGCVVWSLVSGERVESVSAQERVLLEKQAEAWYGGRLNPYELDENGDGVLVLAAGLGEARILADVLAEEPPTEAHEEVLALAAHRAAGRNRDEVLRQLVAAGMSPQIRLHGMQPLHTAALSRARLAAACLLELGAPADAQDEDGATPLHHAVLADDAAMVRLLLQHGADPHVLDADGRDAASYARSEAVSEALEAPAARRGR